MIALGSQENYNLEQNKQKEEEQQQQSKRVIFQDEVIVNGQTVLNIPIEMAFYEQKKQKRKSRWGEKETKKKVHQDITFDPLKAIEFPKELLALTHEDSEMNKLFQEMEQKSNGNNKQSKRNGKWHDEWEKSFNPPPLHVIPRKLESDELEYVIRLYRLDELNKKMSINDYVQWDNDLRSPSPEPLYDPKTGMRINTREQRGREKLQREYADLIEECQKLKPNSFVPPNDYKPLKKQKRIFLPEDDPDVNYIGIILGPRGSTQKILENKSGCRISIRGRGTKQTKYNTDEKMHVFLQADSDLAIEKGTELIDKLLRGEDAEINEIKQTQQYQLQVIQGLIKEDYCENCHEKGHRTWACPNGNLWKKDLIKCDICGDRSHPSIDCPERQKQTEKQNIPGNKIQQEFANFLCELEGGEKAKQLLSFVGMQQQSQQQQQNKLKLKPKSTFLTENVTDILAITNGNNVDLSWQQYQNQNYSISQSLIQMNPQDREKLISSQEIKQKMIMNNLLKEEIQQPSQFFQNQQNQLFNSSYDNNNITKGGIQYYYNPSYQTPNVLNLNSLGGYEQKTQLNITSLTPLNQQQAFIQKMNNMTLPQFELEEQQVNKDLAYYLNPNQKQLQNRNNNNYN